MTTKRTRMNMMGTRRKNMRRGKNMKETLKRISGHLMNTNHNPISPRITEAHHLQHHPVYTAPIIFPNTKLTTTLIDLHHRNILSRTSRRITNMRIIWHLKQTKTIETNEAPTDPASAKLASQMAAAQERQNLHAYANSAAQFGTPNMAHGAPSYPYVSQSTSSALSPRPHQHVKQRHLPRAEKLPVTGYELLASRLSHSNAESDDAKIKPMYRKFEALNHRLLLHLQDEISELEEHLHRLDHADTQSRTVVQSGAVIPASRRAAQAQGGDLEWHKTDVLGRIGFKLNQYSTLRPTFPIFQNHANIIQTKH